LKYGIERRPGRADVADVVSVLFLAWMFAYLDRQILSLLVPSLKTSFLPSRSHCP